jgi:hypothetical protein
MPRATSTKTSVSPGGQGGDVCKCGDGRVRRPCEPLDQPPGDRRREEGIAVRHGADGADEMLGGDILEQEAHGAGLERRADVLIEMERREDDDSGRATGGMAVGRG